MEKMKCFRKFDLYFSFEIFRTDASEFNSPLIVVVEARHGTNATSFIPVAEIMPIFHSTKWIFLFTLFEWSSIRSDEPARRAHRAPIFAAHRI